MKSGEGLGKGQEGRVGVGPFHLTTLYPRGRVWGTVAPTRAGSRGEGVNMTDGKRTHAEDRADCIEIVTALHGQAWPREKVTRYTPYMRNPEAWMDAVRYIYDHRITGTALNAALDSLIAD